MTPTEQKLQSFRADWAKGIYKTRPLVDLIRASEWFEDAVVAFPQHAPSDIQIAEELRGIIEQKEQKLIAEGMQANPIAFFQPSWTQAQILNSWSPQFEPHLAPEGYRTSCDWSGVRIGKTTARVINNIMWMVPNDLEWEMFRPYTDFKGRHVEVFRRPNWDWWQRKGKFVFSDKEPPKNACENWHGCPDENHWKTKLDKEWRKWMPLSCIAMDGKTPRWYFNDRWFETKWGSIFYGKLYESDLSAWSGKELFAIEMDEGPPLDKLEEARIRCQYIGIAFTPREAVNTGKKTKVAKDIYDGKVKLPGPMKHFRFSWEDAPEHVLSSKNKAMRRAVLDHSRDADRVTEEGGFFFSSPVVFEAFNRQRHVLPITGEPAIRAIRNESTPDDLRLFPWITALNGANVFRGFDEGTVHPTSCTWMALLRTGERVIFREYVKSQHSIRERVETIVALSGNVLEPVNFQNYGLASNPYEEARGLAADARRQQATGTQFTRMRESFKLLKIRRTFGDSKMFKVDPLYPLEDFTANYHRAGLKMERATNALPATRCDVMNGLFRPDHTRVHLNPAQDDADKPHGHGLYITKDCEKLITRLENYIWQQVQAGPRVGEFTGKPETLDDDVIDSACYVTNAKVMWISEGELASRAGARATIAA